MKWSSFLKWAVPIGAAVAAPFTFGGSLLGLGSGAGWAASQVGNVASAALGAGATHAGISGATLLGLAGLGANVGTNIYANRTQSRAAQIAADREAEAAKFAAERQAQSEAAQLDFLKEQEAQRKLEAARTQQLNLNAANVEGQRQSDMYNRREGNLTPYRNIGEGAATVLGDLIGLPAGMTRRAYTPLPYTPISGDLPDTSDPKVDAALEAARQGLSPTSASLDQIIARLKAQGITATRARHGVNGSLASDDKLIINGGQPRDLIYNVGGPDARWT